MKHLYLFLLSAIAICAFSSSYCQNDDIYLPVPQKNIGKPLMQALELRQSSRSFSPKSLELQELSNLLWAGFGINRIDGGKRTAPSARNWQDIRIYVFMQSGVYLYHPEKHYLSFLLGDDFRGMTGTQDFVKTAPVNFVYVSDQSKMGNASTEDKMIYSGADAAFIAENVYLYCASQNLATVVRASIDKKALVDILKLTPEVKIVLAQTIGYKPE
jgi:hypothetical protein